MKIKSINQVSFEISTDTTTIITDPMAYEDFKAKFPKSEGDVVLFSQKKYLGKQNILKGFDKLVKNDGRKIFEISLPGEYEIGQVLIQRVDKSPVYTLDSDYARVVYVGLDSKDLNLELFKDLGDVEVLIAPIGCGEGMMSYETLQDVVGEVEPTILIPFAYGSEIGLKSKEDFVKHFGYTNFRDEKVVKISGSFEGEEKSMEVIFLS